MGMTGRGTNGPLGESFNPPNDKEKGAGRSLGQLYVPVDLARLQERLTLSFTPKELLTKTFRDRNPN